ncbi:HNH endonuclease [Aeromonas sp.]|uniref:HNH endonuclease n=1 Tax=Aeromonas sp. TaxID=647 RepID=UPI00258750E3|nr:HNH endonuclease [Aeromonas sp.]MCX7131060.1 HNH endonuclease [Aeromonas sp.]
MKEKLARVCWNTNNWSKPSGSDGKSTGKSFEKDYSYGFEEWLNSDGYLIDGYKYGYLQGVSRGEKTYPGQKINFFLYTKTQNKTFCVGIIYDAYCLTEDERIQAIKDHNRNGFISNIINQLNEINIRNIYRSKVDNYSFVFNIKYKPDSLVLFPNLLSTNKITHKRYTLTDLSSEVLEDINKTRNDELVKTASEYTFEVEKIISSSMDFTQKEQLIKARRGQGLFRCRLEQLEPACRVTGVTNKALLIASHIKPWCECDNAERLDGNNGLLLSPHIDKLFDRGWITFTDSGDLLCAEPDIERALQQWGIELPLNVGLFNPKQAEFLTYHRDEIFRAGPVLSA